MVRKVAGKPLLMEPSRLPSDEPSLSQNIRPERVDVTLKSQEQIEEEKNGAKKDVEKDIKKKTKKNKKNLKG